MMAQQSKSKSSVAIQDTSWIKYRGGSSSSLAIILIPIPSIIINYTKNI